MEGKGSRCPLADYTLDHGGEAVIEIIAPQKPHCLLL
jgi:hypothetical protein